MTVKTVCGYYYAHMNEKKTTSTLLYARTCNRTCWLGAIWSRGGGGAGRIVGFTMAVDGNVSEGGKVAGCWGAKTKSCGGCVGCLVAAAVVSSSSVKSMTDLVLSTATPLGAGAPATTTFPTCACNGWNKTKTFQKLTLTTKQPLLKNTEDLVKLYKTDSHQATNYSSWDAHKKPKKQGCSVAHS